MKYTIELNSENPSDKYIIDELLHKQPETELSLYEQNLKLLTEAIKLNQQFANLKRTFSSIPLNILKYDLGRATGNTTIINSLSTNDDLIIFPTSMLRKLYEQQFTRQRSVKSNTITILDIVERKVLRGHRPFIDKVFIDSASTINTNTLDSLYCELIRVVNKDHIIIELG